MNLFNEAYWTQRYLNEETSWDAGAVTTPIKEYIDQLTDKNASILIPGAGNAHEAEYLFNTGFTNITVIDISPQPLKNIKKRLPDFPEERLLLADFFEHKKTYDLIIEQTFFCALDPSLRKNYAAKMYELLNPSGKLAGVLFNAELNKDKPPFGGSKEEYIHYFQPYFHFNIFETCYNSIKPREGRELFIRLQKK